jgi:hypothetical protein
MSNAKRITLPAFQSAARLAKEQLRRADTNMSGCLSEQEVNRQSADGTPNKAIAQGLRDFFEVTSFEYGRQPLVAQAQAKVDAALALIESFDRDHDGVIEAGAEHASVEKNEASRALAEIAAELAG